MYVKFKKLRFKNFLSYGNGWTELEFSNKLCIINAQNGSGKSTIIDAISFVLFGKPYRDIKMKSLINYVNKKHLEVQIEFDIGKDSYEMMRGLGPAKFELKKNGEKVEALSSKKLNQLEIDKLLGVKYLLFKNVMCIGAISNVPFFNMCLSDRRELLETIFGLTNIADMLDEVKTRRSNDNITIRTMAGSKSGIEQCIKNTTDLIADLDKKSRTFEENKADRIKRVRDHIEQQKSEKTDHESNIEKCNKKLEEMKDEGPTITDLYARISEKKIEATRKSDRLGQITGSLEHRDEAVCPVCGSDLCSSHSQKYFTDLQSEYERIEVEWKALHDEIKEDSDLLSKKRDDDVFRQKIESRITQEQSAIEALDRGITYDETQVTEIEKETNGFDATEQREKLAEYQGQLAEANKQISEIEERVAIDTDLIAILSDSGIKRYFFDEIVPILNMKVNEYIKRFGMDVEVTFDSMLEYTLTRGAFEMEYNGLSNGEKTRVNVAMLLTFYDIAKQLSNWSSSILFIDEIFDTGIDSDGITDFLKELIGMLNGDGNLGVYLISHKLNDLNFSQIQYKFETLRVQKRGCFSTILKG